MKKLSNKGFTLIELLAVITIMGILMMVAIPAVSRTIENSRRDTFADIAHEYINAVRNAFIADNISCYTGNWNSKDNEAQSRVASALTKNVYFFPICTAGDIDECYSIRMVVKGHGTPVVLTKTKIATSTADLMESGGKSPFGSSDIVGYVRITKDVQEYELNADGTEVMIPKKDKDGNPISNPNYNADDPDSDEPEFLMEPKKLENPKTTISYAIKMVDTGLHGIPDPLAESSIKRSAINTVVEEASLTNVDMSDPDVTPPATENNEENPDEEPDENNDEESTDSAKYTDYYPCFIN